MSSKLAPASCTEVRPDAVISSLIRFTPRLTLLACAPLGDQVAEELAGALGDLSGELAVLDVDVPARWLRGIGGDPGQPERLAVHPVDVPTAVRDEDRVVGRHLVQIGAGQLAALSDLGIVVLVADDPLSGRLPGRRLPDLLLDLGQTAQIQIDVGELGDAGAGGVRMGVDEAGA